MTSTRDSTEHPDIAEISDLAEGLLPPSRSAAVRGHLDGCEMCTDVLASLEEIRGLLGGLPEAAPMPDDVARRIDSALAAESLIAADAPERAERLPADTTSGLPHSSASSAAAEESGHAAADVSRETVPAAARGADRTRPSGSAGPGRKTRRRPGRRRVAVIGAALTVVALGLGSLLVTSLNGDDSTGNAARNRTTVADTFSASTLEQQVAGLLVKATASKAPRTLGIQGERETNSPKLDRLPTVPGCVRRGLDEKDAAALVVEKGVYQGKQALLIVLPDASDTARVTAYLVDATCVDRPSSGDAQVLLKDSYTRP